MAKEKKRKKSVDLSTSTEYRFQLLTQEMSLIQQRIGDFDGILFRIKSWAITLLSTFVLFSLSESGSTLLLSFAIVVVFLFWFLDAHYRKTQLQHVERYRQIQGFLRSDAFEAWIAHRSLPEVVLPDIAGRHLPQEKQKSGLQVLFDTSIVSFYLVMLVLIAGMMTWMLAGQG